MSVTYVLNVIGLNTCVAFKIDDTDPNYTYIGYTKPENQLNVGSGGWMIIRMTKADGGNANLNTGAWANGLEWNLQPTNGITWQGRAGYTYAP